MFQFSPEVEAQLKEDFHQFRNDPLHRFIVRLRQVRAGQLRQLLRPENNIELETFDNDVWPIEKRTFLRNRGISLRIFDDKNGLSHLEKALETEQVTSPELEAALTSGDLELHGNYMWGQVTARYDARNTNELHKRENIYQITQILNSELAPIEKLEDVQRVHGFGPSNASGLVMVFHPEDFCIVNRVTKDVLQKFGISIDSLTDSSFQDILHSLKDTLQAQDFLELDWFLFLHSSYIQDAYEHNPATEKRRWFEAVLHVLQEANKPLHYSEIADLARASGVHTQGKPPEQIVSRILTTHPELFERVERGVYQLKEIQLIVPKEAVIYELDPRIKKELQTRYNRLFSQGALLSKKQLDGYYENFRKKFGPEQLARLDGNELLETLHGSGTKDSMAYWLEFKNDKEFPAIFGGIAGGAAYKFGLFRKKDTGKWTTGTAQHPIELTLEQAIETAKDHRDQLLAGCDLLENLPEDGTDEDYETLQQAMDKVAPDVSNTAWGHKYFSLIYPDKLDDFHVTDYQRHHLIKLLQVPPEMENRRYAAGGRFVALMKQMDLPMNTFTKFLNERNGDPRPVWRIGTTAGGDGKSYWPEMREGNYCAIGWMEQPDFSDLVETDENKAFLKQLIQQSFPHFPPPVVTKTQRQIGDFLWGMKHGDIILASNGASVLGIGRVVGDYHYNPDSGFPHQRPVEWLSLETWKQPDPEGLLTTLYKMRKPVNLIEVEKRILDARYGTLEAPKIDPYNESPVIYYSDT